MEKENNIPTAENSGNSISVENNVISSEKEKAVHTERRCVNCQALLEDGQMFCPECGTSQKKMCPQCGSEVQDDQSFCPSCGQKITNDTGNNSQDVINQFNATVFKQQKKPKNILIVVGGIVFIALAIAFAIFHPSKFERVKNEAIQIAGQATTNKNYFILDTNPYNETKMKKALVDSLLPKTQENTLDAIKYVNEELGFNGSLYSKMLETTALMGRQKDENKKYKVSWTYHPDDGLEVTYEKK